MSRPVLHRGPTLPYRPMAGVVPCPGGWLVAGAKLQGITLSVEIPQVMRTLVEVLDYRPSFEIIALHAPIGLLDDAHPGGRACDAEARRLLGPRRGAAVASAPWRRLLEAPDAEIPVLAGLSAPSRKRLAQYREVVREMQPYRQRTVYEVHPEVSFHQLNNDAALRFGKMTQQGRAERRAILEARFPGAVSYTHLTLPTKRIV